MIREGRFGVHEAVCLATIAICNKIFMTTPGYITRVVGNTDWYMTLISCASAIVFFTFIYLLLKRFPGRNIVEIYDASLGRILGFVFSLALLVPFFASAGIYSREFVDVIKVFNFPETPPVVLTGVLITIAAVSAYFGLETIARVSKLAAYFALSAYLLLFALSSEYFEVSNIFPILGYGLDRTVTTGILRSTAYAEVLVIAVFAGSLQGIGHIKKAGYVSLLLSGFLLSLGLLCYTMVFDYASSQEINAPIYIMTRAIKYGTFLERMDPLFLFLWVITTIIYISTMFYATVSIYCKMFRLQDTRPVIVPMAVLVFTLAVLPKEFPGAVQEYIQGLRLYGNITFFILPFTALIVGVLRKKKGVRL